MPLIVITGTPSSGKTKRAVEFKEHFEKAGKDVRIISEYDEIKRAGFDINAFYKDSQKEKQIRGILKSEVLRVIGPTNLVIFDGSNYIKGYRYELYCATKANKSTQCTIQCVRNFEDAFDSNLQRENKEEKYTREIFDALCMRYEYPDYKNRWDSPLFTLQTTDSINFDAISECLFEKKPPPPNMSTQNPPLSDTNFLYELDRITKELTTQLMAAKKIRATEVKIPGQPNQTINIANATISQLNMLRRQYIVYSKMHTPDVNNILTLYVQYLKTNLAN